MFPKCILVLIIASHFAYISTADSSYFVSPYKTGWIAAVESCQRMGMRLAILDSVQKHDAAVEVGASIKPADSQFFGLWIGASDLAYGGGSFMWHDTGNWVQFHRWREGQPSGASEHCVALYYWPDLKFNWTWNDASCDTTLYALCEPRQGIC